MSVFQKTVAAILAASLAACGGSRPSGAIPFGEGLTNRVGPKPMTSAQFKRVVAWGSKGKVAVAQCSQGYKVIAGGSSSSDGSVVGTGYADSNRSAWIVKPDSKASAEAFATCVLRKTEGKRFQWRVAAPVNGLAAAQCKIGDVLVTGYGIGTVTSSWFDGSTNSYWVSGGGTAYASCAARSTGIAIKHAWNESQKPKSVFAGCGGGLTVIGGSMGNTAWPGPPVQQHPGSAGSPNHGDAGWWTFSNAANELTWAACIQT